MLVMYGKHLKQKNITYVLITILSSQLLILHPATMNFQVDSLRCLGQRLESLGTTSGC